MWLLRTISIPYLARHRLRTLLTLVGIAAGVASIVATGAVCDSVFSSFAIATRSAMGDADLRVSAAGAGIPDELVEPVRAVEGVTFAEAVIEGFVSFEADPTDELAVFGVDLVSDHRGLQQGRHRKVETPDEIEFIANPDSIALARDFAEKRGLSNGDTIAVLGPSGARTLVVRGLLTGGAEAALFAGKVGVMDLPAAQLLLQTGQKVDHIDVWIAPDADTQEVTAAVDEAVHGLARVGDAPTTAERAKQLLFAIRVFLTMAAFVAVVVGFFIVYHTVAASVHQRRKHIAVLHALGVSRKSLLVWLVCESTLLASIAIALGFGLGIVFARVSLATFGGVTTAWVHHPAPSLLVSGVTAGLSILIALVTTWSATLLAARSFLGRPTAGLLRTLDGATSRPGPPYTPLLASLAGFVATALLIAVAPTTLPYSRLVAYVLLVNGLALLSFGLLGPAVARTVGRGLQALARKRRGISVLLASSNLARNPGSFIIVVTAIVMGLGSTLACFSLTASLEKSALAWMSEHYRSDLVLSAKGAFLRILTAPTIAQEVVDQVAAVDGVRQIQGVRAIEVTVAERPAVLLAFDRVDQGFTLFDADWSRVADAFWSGQGVLVSDNLARLRTIERGDTIGLDTPSGRHRFRVLGTFPDYTGGSQLGSLAIARDTFKTVWADALVNRIRLWIDNPSHAAELAQTLNARFSKEYGLYALTFGDVHDEIAHLIEDAFSIMYALVAVALVVSFVGITNFLITGLADRIDEVRVLQACGLSPRHTLGTVVSEGVLVGVVGVLLGVIAGAVVSRIIIQQSVPMVTGWMFLYVFPTMPAIAVSIGAVVLAAAAGLPSGWLAMRWRHYAEGAVE